MPTLEIAVDARGVEQGLRQANKALDETAQKADRAEREVKQMGQASHQAGRDMGAAFAATGGGLAITHGLEGISSGFRSGNSAMAAFAASQALLDLGRFAEDMKAVTAATGGATTVFGTLGTIIKAHPLMTIATVLAAAAAGMAIFTSETEEAADEMERLGDAMQKAQASQYVQQVLGLSQQPGVQAQQAALMSALESYRQGAQRGQFQTFGQFGGALGLSPAELEARLGRAGPDVRVAMPTGMDFTGRFTPFAQRRVPEEAAKFIVRQLYQELLNEARELQRGPGLGTMGYGINMMLRAQQNLAPRNAAEPLGPSLPPGFQRFADPNLLPTSGYVAPEGQAVYGTGGLGFGINMGMQTLTQMQAFANEQALEAENRMRELVSLGETFGQTIGDAFFRVAEGTMTARQAMAELVRQFAQMAAQSAFRGIGGQLFGSFAPTQTQNMANVGGVPPGLSGGVPGQG